MCRCRESGARLSSQAESGPDDGAPFLIRAGCLTIVSSCEADQKSAAIKVPFELWSALESCVDTTGCQFLLLVAQGKFRDTSVHLRNLVWLPSQSRASGDGLKLHAVASCHWVF
jgi:hypothetical protein